MKRFIKNKLEAVYSDFQIAAKESDGLCELKKFSFAGGASPDYGNHLVRMYYMLKYFPAYLAEYYLMYQKLLNFNFLPHNDLDILSIGCGCGIDYWGYHFIAKEQINDFKTTTSYTGYDINTWEYTDSLRNEKFRIINDDIAKLDNLNSGDYDYNVIVFPKSISDLHPEVFGKLVKAIESTNFERKRIAVVCSLMQDEQALNYDWSRLKKIITTIMARHNYSCEDDLEKYITATNPDEGLVRVVNGFDYTLDIENTINSTLNLCPNFIENGKSCKNDCTAMNRWPILKQRYVNFAVRRLTRND
ncbi:hypothetical protein dsx2_2344 [Desulfovibrio sp. X2]|uniref:hypothetical protein n=1 Tax=Desulfovibrio sp. X2 TaxID=941449 RepID=UPI000358920C|nr:hypothetical protein [Desulfovibrio sp. X2]EPR43493.1 hypothetical protein dsx2_2344 [Desulfovibrio sp. X2]